MRHLLYLFAICRHLETAMPKLSPERGIATADMAIAAFRILIERLRTNTRFGLLLSILALPLCCGSAAADDAADIKARLQQWTTSFNSRDKTAACDLFSKSLVSDVRGQGEADYTTRCAIISKAIDDPQRSFHYDLNIKEVIVDRTIAIVRLDWALKISPGDVTSTETGLDVFRKEADGRWRIIRYMSYDNE
jgi:steroid delta-isomerase